MTARRGWLALGALGVALLVPFEFPVTVTLGIIALLGFVAWGVFLIATPEFLRRGEDEERNS
ncbi:MAG TPA: hypothetical protein VF752_12790 [Thermoleophilaceae bacterium]